MKKFNFTPMILNDYKEMTRLKQAFTLVEVLIVVVIIGILSAALIPRLTGHMARTRDLKRQMDLRNIAAAVESYKGQHGKFPLVGSNPREHVWSLSKLATILGSYLSDMPTDPSRNTFVDVWLEKPYDYRKHASTLLKKWEYLFQYGDWLYKKTPDPSFLLLIAKVETPDVANYIIFNRDATNKYFFPGNAWYHSNGVTHPNLSADQYNIVWDSEWKKAKNFVGCDEVRKTESPKITDVGGKRICEYSSTEQLYYIVFVGA